MAPSPEAIRREMRGRVTQTSSGGLKLAFQVEVSPSKQVRINGRPVGKPGVLGWLSAHEHVSLQLIELHNELERLAKGIPGLLLPTANGLVRA
jgi:hypothetical protein